MSNYRGPTPLFWVFLGCVAIWLGILYVLTKIGVFG